MRVINETPYALGWKIGKIRPPVTSATFVVKGTFDLRPGGPAVPSASQGPVAGDRYRDDDPACAYLYPQDFAAFKPVGEWMLVGHAYAPGGKPTSSLLAGARVGELSKSVLVVGDRFAGSPDPVPFVKMSLSYENAFGGPGYPRNPLGKGFVEERTPEGIAIRRRPNLIRPGEPVSEPVSVVGFGPIPITWEQRRAKTGTFDEKWKRERWPWMPEDADPSFENAAPEDQRCEGYWTGDESLRFENLHRDMPIYESRLPGVRIRLFSDERDVAMNLDTVRLDLDGEKAILLWRGVVDLAGDALPEEGLVLCVEENADGERRDFAAYRERAIAVEEPVEERVPAPTAPAVPGREPADGASWEDADLTGLDLSGRDLSNRNLRGAVFRGARLAGTNLSNADLSGTDFEGADLSGANLHGAKLEGADFTAASLVECDLSEATLDRALFADADLSGATLERARGEDAIFAGARLHRAVLRKAVLPRADFSGAGLEEADLSEADLTEGSLEEAVGPRVNATKALFRKLKASGACLEEGNFASVLAPDSIWEGARLARAVFVEAELARAELEAADLTGAEFRAAELSEARLVRAILKDSRFPDANLFRARLQGANLEGGDFRGANLFQAEFYQAVTERALFEGANVARTLVESR